MHLLRIQSGKAPKIAFTGKSRKEVVDKIKEMKLQSYHDAYYFEPGHFEKLGMNGEVRDYYIIASPDDLAFYENKQF
jgi:NAD(P)H-flavin reductase